MAKLLITSYKVDDCSWHKTNIEAVRKGILSSYPGAKQCLFIYEEKG